MNNKKPTDNVIQFPTRQREAAPESNQKQTEQASVVSMPVRAAAPKKRRMPKKTVVGGVLAIMLATGAANRFAFNSDSDISTVAMSSEAQTARGIASVERFTWKRDAQWEKSLAESLASAQVRGLASMQIGRTATLEDKLRWGILDQQIYTITYQPGQRHIRGIMLQDSQSDPTYVGDRLQFLNDYGPLLVDGFKTAELKSVESDDGRIIEAYTIHNSTQPGREARFELDQYKRLISLKVQ